MHSINIEYILLSITKRHTHDDMVYQIQTIVGSYIKLHYQNSLFGHIFL